MLWEDLEGAGREGGGRGDRDGEHMETHGRFISMYDKILAHGAVCLCHELVLHWVGRVQGDVYLSEGRLFLALWGEQGKTGASEKKTLPCIASVFLSPHNEGLSLSQT